MGLRLQNNMYLPWFPLLFFILVVLDGKTHLLAKHVLFYFRTLPVHCLRLNIDMLLNTNEKLKQSKKIVLA